MSQAMLPFLDWRGDMPFTREAIRRAQVEIRRAMELSFTPVERARQLTPPEPQLTPPEPLPRPHALRWQLLTITPAEKRARELLLRYLSPTQRAQFELSSNWSEWFDVTGSLTHNRYRIYLAGWVIGLFHDPLGYLCVRHFCFRSGNGELPYYDQMLAKKIALEMDEPAVLHVAGSLFIPDDVIQHYENPETFALV
jgi:hypothetical protein